MIIKIDLKPGEAWIMSWLEKYARLELAIEEKQRAGEDLKREFTSEEITAKVEEIAKYAVAVYVKMSKDFDTYLSRLTEEAGR